MSIVSILLRETSKDLMTVIKDGNGEERIELNGVFKRNPKHSIFQESLGFKLLELSVLGDSD